MRIGVLALMAGREAGGPDTYEVETLRALARVDRTNEYIVYCTGAEAPGAIAVRAPHVSYRVLPRPRLFGISAVLPALLVRDRVDVLHSTFTPPPFAPGPQVLTMHCLSSFVHPEFYSPLIAWRLNSLLRIGMRSASCIVCVSRTTADDVHARFGVSQERLAVAYNGVGAQFVPAPRGEAARRIADELGITGPYALFIGKLEPRKNVVRLIKAFARFRARTGSQTRLVLAGHRTGVTPAIDDLIERLGIGGAVFQAGFVRGEMLPSLYSAARMFLFPSLWEGFGIPIVEAMACGTPVLTSNISCLPEIAGDAAVVVDPQSVDGIADGIARLEASPELRARLVERGFVRAKLFNWDEAARTTIAAYERAARGRVGAAAGAVAPTGGR